jgi:23S rRNA (adenine2503-C2)-methyltransferase
MHLFSLTCNEFAAVLRERWDKGMFHASAAYRHVFKMGIPDIASVPEYSSAQGLARELCDAFDCRAPFIENSVEHDGVTKIVFQLPGSVRVESVLIPMPHRSTLCLSSQAGCRMGCLFCHTGSCGFVRNLTTDEIVGQVYAVRHGLGRRVDNIVFMGMGEPLDNFDNVAQAIRILSDQRGFDIAHSHMTVSTAGLPDGIRRLGELGWPTLKLAISLNAATDAVRSQLMPVNRRYPLAVLKQALHSYPLRPQGVLFIEYVLLKGVNDSQKHAAELVRFLDGLPVRVNVIRYNPVSGGLFESPAGEDCRGFCARLVGEGLFVRLRASRGLGLQAACGQLGGTTHLPPDA